MRPREEISREQNQPAKGVIGGEKRGGGNRNGNGKVAEDRTDVLEC